tara:strand:+ start:546 stop:827 length:282 start_codon:yes stop_codon:yes gene_type:complete
MEKQNINKALEKAVILDSRWTDAIFGALNDTGLNSFTSQQIVELSYNIGKRQGYFKSAEMDCQQFPDYQQMITRLNTIEKMLYKEAEKRDRGF